MRLDVTKREWTKEQFEDILIADEQVFNQMACHKTKEEVPIACTGWVISQLKGRINNVGLRFKIITKTLNPDDYDLDFPVHQSIKEAYEAKALPTIKTRR